MHFNQLVEIPIPILLNIAMHMCACTGDSRWHHAKKLNGLWHEDGSVTVLISNNACHATLMGTLSIRRLQMTLTTLGLVHGCLPDTCSMMTVL